MAGGKKTNQKPRVRNVFIIILVIVLSLGLMFSSPYIDRYKQKEKFGELEEAVLKLGSDMQYGESEKYCRQDQQKWGGGAWHCWIVVAKNASEENLQASLSQSRELIVSPNSVFSNEMKDSAGYTYSYRGRVNACRLSGESDIKKSGVITFSCSLKTSGPLF